MKGYRILIDFARDRSAAIAPMYAMSLFGLIMIAGVGWDYSRLMTMDSELQNAADQAALAAATQLTGTDGAIENARDAATNFLATSGSQWVNETKLANDDDGRAIVGLDFDFYAGWNHATDLPVGDELDDDEWAEARYVRVTVAPRVARYALTAIGGVINSGGVRASAVATLEEAVCNVPPLMVCAPTGNAGFPSASDIGIALDLRQGPQSSSVRAPGNFDLLDVPYDLTGRRGNQNQTLGLNADSLGCTSEPIDTKTGNVAPQNRAFNSRFGIYEGGTPSCLSSSSDPNRDYCPGDLTRHDFVRRVRVQGNGSNATCENTPGGTLIPVSDVPISPPLPQQGYPLDTCQTDGSTRCLSFGDGDWPAQSYMDAVHDRLDIDTIEGIDADGNGRITRYEVYQWERADPSRTVSKEFTRVRNGGRTDLYCSAPKPVAGSPPIVPSPTQKDRRVVTVGVTDCTGQSGKFDVNFLKFVDVFVLGPVESNTGDLRAEIIGPARRADGRSGFQNFGRKKAVLVQ